jgi:hypothetical protein
MLSTISWQSYFITLGLATLGYYLAIYFLYYRADFPKWIAGFWSIPKEKSSGHVTSTSTSTYSIEEQVFDSCLSELAAFFDQARKRKWAKAELLYALKHLLKKYAALRSPEYKEPLKKILISQSELNCSIYLSAEESEQVWLCE